MKGFTNSGYLHIHQKILCNVSIHLKSGFSYFLCHLVLGWESNPQWVYWSCNPEPKGSKKLCRAKGKCRMEILCSSLLVIVPHIVIWYKNSFQTNIFNSKYPFISFFKSLSAAFSQSLAVVIWRFRPWGWKFRWEGVSGPWRLFCPLWRMDRVMQCKIMKASKIKKNQWIHSQVQIKVSNLWWTLMTHKSALWATGKSS